MSNAIVTRFAPSPTGYLHVGGARTALFNWLLARHSGGQFLLRIEDTDLARSTQQACDQLLEDLKWLGLHWDNAQLVFQSKRLEVYNRVIDDLIGRGLAYKAWETDEELEAQRKTQGRQYRYRRPVLSEQQVRDFEASGRAHVVRFVMSVQRYTFDDVVLGAGQGIGPEEVQDFVIRKGDGMPTYHFAVVVDDAEMGVTHVLRGQEHLLNTCKHIALQEALGYARPVYGHMPIIMNPDGSKMGKRDRDKKVRHYTNNFLKNSKTPVEELAGSAGLEGARVTMWLKSETAQLDPFEHAKLMPLIGLKEADLPEILVHDFRKNGYLPEALLNYVALLGWSPGGDRERMSIEEMIRLFAVENIGKANAKFDRAKLLAFNTQACDQAAPDRLVKAMRDYLSVNPESPVNQATDEQLGELLRMKKGFRTLREVDEVSRFFFVADEAIAFDAKAVEKVLKKDNGAGLTVLKDLRSLLAEAQEWRHEALEAGVKQYCDARGLGLGNVAQPIRVAVSGGTVSPPIFHSLEFLGRGRTLARIERCVGMQ